VRFETNTVDGNALLEKRLDDRNCRGKLWAREFKVEVVYIELRLWVGSVSGTVSGISIYSL
jgi:hypothetical protein